MPIQLTDEQWASIAEEKRLPIRVNGPHGNFSFVLLPTDVYDHFKSLFEADPVTASERQYHLQQFGKRAGWDDPAMDIYDELNPWGNL